jgi:hypothetical protein
MPAPGRVVRRDPHRDHAVEQREVAAPGRGLGQRLVVGEEDTDAAERAQIVLAERPVAGDLHQLRLDRVARLQRVVDEQHERRARLQLAHHQLAQHEFTGVRVAHRRVDQQVVRRQIRRRDVHQRGARVGAADVGEERRRLADAVLAEDLPGLPHVDHRVDEGLQARRLTPPRSAAGVVNCPVSVVIYRDPVVTRWQSIAGLCVSGHSLPPSVISQIHLSGSAGVTGGACPSVSITTASGVTSNRRPFTSVRPST